MTIKCTPLFFIIVFLTIGISGCDREKVSTKIITNRLIAQGDNSWLADSMKISPDGRHITCPARVGNKWYIVFDTKIN
ncbi:MAG: hypothetical protein HZB59_08105 [Ignavibacteriales bacterium]|nr:hypothetical protein [Ignavibacteriales bacterium]